MKHLPLPIHCCGCSVCQTVCPKGAVSMEADSEGFLQRKVDKTRCIACGLCEKACPVLGGDEPRVPLGIYAAKSKNDDLRAKSSSGGVFTLLAEDIFKRGGIVFGAGFDHESWRIVHKSAENEQELSDLRGSKYVQSDSRGIYEKVASALNAGRETLFTGTPCQIAALRRYCELAGVKTDNLYLVDVVCHATPSPLAWKKYLEKRCSDTTGTRIALENVFFRNKKKGWKRYSLALRFANAGEYSADLKTDAFLRGFLAELFNRKSCHDCHFRELRSGADLTVGDYWNVHESFPEMDDDMGTSLVLVNTERGDKMLMSISENVVIARSDLADAVRVNSALVKSPLPHVNREKFFVKLQRKRDFDKLVNGLLPASRPLWRRVASKLKRLLAAKLRMSLWPNIFYL